VIQHGGWVCNGSGGLVRSGIEYHYSADASAAPFGYTPYAYPHPLQIGSTPPPALVGDLNSDGTVNALDWGIMNSKWFTSNPQSDLNSDGLVNSIDFGLMNSHWGETL
jgi:hypothetical protein